MEALQIWEKNMDSKKEIRNYVFKKRKEFSLEEAEKGNEKICKKVLALPQFQEAECIYAYADYKKEAGTRAIIQAAWDAGKRVAVPKVVGPHEMKYYFLETFDQLEPGYYDIPEPAWGQEADVEDALILVPGVAFDEERHRVGYGQGFYDRYLSAHRRHKTVALAFDFQIVDHAPAEPTDVFPDLVVTEKRIIL